MLVSLFSSFLLLFFLLLSIISSLYHPFKYLYHIRFLPILSISTNTPTPPNPLPSINQYSSYLLPIFRNDAGKTMKTLKHTHTAQTFVLSWYSLSFILSSCFIFLLPCSISINISEMGKVGKDMYHYVQDFYGVLGCVIHLGGEEMNVKGKGKYGRVETMRLKNLGGIKSEGGLLSLFVVVRWSAVWKFQLHCFPLWCVIFCVAII